MDPLEMFILARQHQARLLAEARAEQIGGTRRGVDDRPGLERLPRWPRHRSVLRVARGLRGHRAPAR